KTLVDARADLVLVQGDTTTALATSLAAFYARIPVAHVEAGLRTHDLANPFPEEMNRKVASVVADIHLAPTPLARRELLKESVPRERIVVTGNPVVDALHRVLDWPFDFAGGPLEQFDRIDGRLLLVTSHRRESFGRDLENICLALCDLVSRFADLRIAYPVHLNPRVRETVVRLLDGVDRVHLIDPLDYVSFVNLMRRSALILTDSGGVQEEAPTLGKLLLVGISIVFLISGIDDCCIDLVFAIRALYRRRFVDPYVRPLTATALETNREQAIAVMIPAWHEADVIRRMLLNALSTIEYS